MHFGPGAFLWRPPHPCGEDCCDAKFDHLRLQINFASGKAEFIFKIRGPGPQATKMRLLHPSDSVECTHVCMPAGHCVLSDSYKNIWVCGSLRNILCGAKSCFAVPRPMKPCSNSRLDLVLSMAFRPCSARNLLLPWFEELFYMDQNPGSR